MTSGTSKAIVFLVALLLILETVLFVKFSQHGLDYLLCVCAKPSVHLPDARVLNGVPASRSDFKWVASVFLDKTVKGSIEYIAHVCTATILNPSFVLTAGHCFLGQGKDMRQKPYRDQLFVTAGAAHNLTGAYLGDENRRKIRQVRVHPLFEQNAAEFDKRVETEDLVIYHDIALAELEEPFPLGDQILPACLFEREQDDFVDEFIVTGFGYRSLQKLPPRIVKKGNKRIQIDVGGDYLQMTKMRQSHVCAQRLKDFNKSLTICIRDNRNRTATFLGDSGGPVHLVQKKSLIVGIVSLGDSDPLESSLTMATKIDQHLDWIESHVNGHRCLPNGQAFRFHLWKFLVFILFFFVTVFVMFCLLAAIG